MLARSFSTQKSSVISKGERNDDCVIYTRENREAC